MINLILAGGSGERVKHKTSGRKKQFCKMGGENTLLQNTIDRNLFIGLTVISINSKDIGEIEPEKYTLIIEPQKKNTAAAIALACFEFPNTIVVVTPTDHKISGNYQECIGNAIDEMNDDEIVLFGILPSEPSDQYGYIRIDKMREKPSENEAIELISTGWLWNSGITIFNSDTYLKELRKYNSELFDLVYGAHKEKINFDRAMLADLDLWNKIDAKSIDYEVLEKSDKIRVMEADFTWMDLG